MTAFVDTGSLLAQVIFGIVPEFLVMIGYVVAGILTRNLRPDCVEDRKWEETERA